MSILDSHSVLCDDVERADRPRPRRIVEVLGIFKVAVDSEDFPDCDAVEVLDFAELETVIGEEPWFIKSAWMRALCELPKAPTAGDVLPREAGQAILAACAEQVRDAAEGANGERFVSLRGVAS